MNAAGYFLQESVLSLYVTVFLFSICIGSFLNVVILRLPQQLFAQWKIQRQELLNQEYGQEYGKEQEKKQNGEKEIEGAVITLSKPASYCPSCKMPLSWHHNIPLVSYLFLAGKCSFCKKKISIRYPIIELTTALLAMQAASYFQFGWPLVFSLIFLFALITLSWIDFDHQLLPDDIVLPLLWCGLLVNCFATFTDLKSAVIGAALGYMTLWTLYQIHHRLTGKEGMGYGDFKLLAAIGAWLGWQMLPVVILLASISGTIIAVLMIVVKKKSKDIAIPFGPYLAIAGWISLLCGDKIITQYLQIFNI